MSTKKAYSEKELQVKRFYSSMLNKSLTMFDYDGLPDTIPAVELEKQLQKNGYSVIAKFEDNLYAFQAGFSGQDVYNNPTHAIIANPALKFNATLELGVDCVLIKNDDLRLGLNSLYKHYGKLIVENEITMLLTDYNLRMPTLISANDDSTIENANEYLKKVIDGKLGVVGESKLFDSLKVQATQKQGMSNFADLFGYQQFLLSQLNNEIGLATNNNMKKERLTTSEIEINQNATYPLVDNMMMNRVNGLEKLKDVFGVDVTVSFGSIWDSSEANVSRETIDEEPEAEPQTEEPEPEAEPQTEEPEPEAEPQSEEPEPEAEPKDEEPKDEEKRGEKK